MDIVDGVICYVLVGYFVCVIKIEECEGECDKVIIIEWELYEILMVSVFVDVIVGVGCGVGELLEEVVGDFINIDI